MIPLIADFDPTRYNIVTKHGKSRPYLIVFERLQIIGEEMVSWNANSKKRPGDSPEPSPSKRSASGSGPSGSQSLDGDVMVG